MREKAAKRQGVRDRGKTMPRSGGPCAGGGTPGRGGCSGLGFGFVLRVSGLQRSWRVFRFRVGRVQEGSGGSGGEFMRRVGGGS